MITIRRRAVRLLAGLAFALADAAFCYGLYYSCAYDLFPRAAAFGGAGAVIWALECLHAIVDEGPPRSVHLLFEIVTLMYACTYRSLLH